MKIKIHRGGNEIGGNCVELSSQGASLLLDLGKPLMDEDFDEEALPEVDGLTDGTNPNLLAILISHPHLDHYGLVEFASPLLPKYMGKEAYRMLNAASAFTKFGINFENVRHYCDRMTFQIGPFSITPYLADHSAFDSYSFVIEADEKRIFYSGDLRGHGWKGWAFKRLLDNPPQPIDAMLLEGITLSREENQPVLPETKLVDLITEKIKQTEGLVLVSFSGQNIDRLVTFYKATLKSRRLFVADFYIAHLLHAIGRTTLPDPTSSSTMRVFLPARLKRQIIRNSAFDIVKPFYSSRIYPEQLLGQKNKLVMTFRASMATDFEKNGLLDDARLIYSMWPGYLEQSTPNLRDWCAEKNMKFDILHTSGHASKHDLTRLVKALRPKTVLPIHTLSPEKYGDLGAPVSLSANNQWYEVT